MSLTRPLGIALNVSERNGLERIAEPIRIGVPLPRGAFKDVASLKLTDEAGQNLPLQARAVANWSDGSLQWVLIDTLIGVGAGESTTLRVEEGSNLTEPRLNVAESDSGITVDTGAAIFRIPRNGAALLSSVSCAGQEQLKKEGLHIAFAIGSDKPRQFRIESTRTEESGFLRASIAVTGVITGTDRRRPVEVVARLTMFAQSPVLNVELLIRNPRRAIHRGGLWDLGDPGSQLIREMAIVVAPASPPTQFLWREEPQTLLQEADAASNWVLIQDSSGGEGWKSSNHLGADGSLTVSFRGFQVRDASGQVLTSGYRATPCIQLGSPRNAITCAIADFWQNFPKALRIEEGKMQVALFPRETSGPVELQGGEQKQHRIWFAFGAPEEGIAEITRLQQPLEVTLDPHAVEASLAMHGFAAPRADDDVRLASYMKSIVDGNHSFFAGREAIDEYGWRNFGDVYADHEAVNHSGNEPFISHYNNQYDVVQGLLIQWLRSADCRWMQLMRDAARHTIDIDIYHTEDDKAAYNGGLFWHSDHYLPAGLATHRTYSKKNAKGNYGGGPDNEHNYTSGLLHYYYLTGDRSAADAVRELANFVIAMDDGSRTVLRYFSKAPTGNASKTVSPDYHSAGRGAGNSINALLDGYRLTRERRYLIKAEELVRRCIHPQDDISSLALDEPEYRWSYLVFLQVLAKYLDIKQELGEKDTDFCHARASLLHYARWMQENERPYKDVLHKVLLPTETWSAQDIRKARVLESASRYASDRKESSDLRSKAREFENRCLTDLFEFSSSLLVRPRVLLSVYGCRHPGGDGSVAETDRCREYSNDPLRTPFVSQRRHVLAELRRKLPFVSRWLK